MSAPFDVSAAHRWFAIELNNRAWDLIELPSRSPEESLELVSAAHASRHHWRQIGTPLNCLRGDLLVAAAYLAAGQADSALRYADQALLLASESGVEATPFDLACAHGTAAGALAKLGQHDAARSRYAEATVQPLEADDRAVFEKLCPAV